VSIIIGRGSCLVVLKYTTGGNSELDIVIIINGEGISSSPWLVKSLIDNFTYNIKCKDIVKESYYKPTIDDAKIIYKSITGNSPKMLE